MKRVALYVALGACALAGCAKPARGTDFSTMSVDSSGRVVSQDQDGRDFNMEAKSKPSQGRSAR